MRLLAPLVIVLVAAAGGRANPIVSLDLLTPAVPATGPGQLAVRLNLAAGDVIDLGSFSVQVSTGGGPVQFTGVAFPTPFSEYVFAPGDSFAVLVANPGPSNDSFPQPAVVNLSDLYIGANPSGDTPLGSLVMPTTYTLAVLDFEGTNAGGATTVQFSLLNPEFANGAFGPLPVDGDGPVTVSVGAAVTNNPPVPEPVSVALFAAAGVGAWRLRRRAG